MSSSASKLQSQIPLPDLGQEDQRAVVEVTNVNMDHDFFFKGCLGPEVGRSLWPSGVMLFGLFCVLNSNRS